MPDQISVSEFLSETTEDYNSPTTSSFTTRLQSCRNTVNVLEEVRPHFSPQKDGWTHEDPLKIQKHTYYCASSSSSSYHHHHYYSNHKDLSKVYNILLEMHASSFEVRALQHPPRGPKCISLLHIGHSKKQIIAPVAVKVDIWFLHNLSSLNLDA